MFPYKPIVVAIQPSPKMPVGKRRIQEEPFVGGNYLMSELVLIVLALIPYPPQMLKIVKVIYKHVSLMELLVQPNRPYVLIIQPPFLN